MSLRTKVLGLVEVVLRVPPLFVIDEILKTGFGISQTEEFDLSSDRYKSTVEYVGGEEHDLNYTSSIRHDPVFYTILIVSLGRLALCCAGNTPLIPFSSINFPNPWSLFSSICTYFLF